MPGAVLLRPPVQYYFVRRCSTTSIGNAVLLHPPMQYYFCGERNCKTERAPHAGAQARAGSEGMRSCALCGRRSSPDAGESPFEPRIIQKCLLESPFGPVLQIVRPGQFPCLGEGGRLSWADSPCHSCKAPGLSPCHGNSLGRAVKSMGERSGKKRLLRILTSTP